MHTVQKWKTKNLSLVQWQWSFAAQPAIFVINKPTSKPPRNNNNGNNERKKVAALQTQKWTALQVTVCIVQSVFHIFRLKTFIHAHAFTMQFGFTIDCMLAIQFCFYSQNRNNLFGFLFQCLFLFFPFLVCLIWMPGTAAVGKIAGQAKNLFPLIATRKRRKQLKTANNRVVTAHRKARTKRTTLVPVF